MKVAIVCDWLTGIGGAEKVVLALHKLYPDAPIYTSQYDSSKINWFRDADVRTLWLQKLPKSLKKFLPILRAYAFSRLDLSAYDLVISSSGAEAKGVKTGSKTIHICYMHSPTHYYWVRQEEYLKNPGFPKGLNWLAKLGLKTFSGPLKSWDKHAAKKPNYIIANSTYTKKNIKKFYGRDSEVIYPPVDISRFKTNSKKSQPRHGFVIAGRQTPYKRIDLAVRACNELSVPLVVIGDGPEHKNLEKIAKRNITFLSQVSDQTIADYFSSALGFIFPGKDDFGIVAVEALAAGTPVVAYKAGGALDYVEDGKNGVFFSEQNSESLARALTRTSRKSFDYLEISSSAKKFSEAKFDDNISKFIEGVAKH